MLIPGNHLGSMSGDAVDTLKTAEPMDGRAWVLLNVGELHPSNHLPLQA